MMTYYLGIDIGTTSSKAVAFSETGEVIKSFSVGYDMQHPEPNRSEQDPDEILQAVICGLNKVTEAFAPDYPAFISFSAAMHSLIAVDEKGDLLSQCLIWADNRADVVAENLRNSDTGIEFYHLTGVPIHSMSPLCKLLWMKEHQPELFHTAHKFIGIKEYIFLKLFGSFVVDTSIASATGLLNTKTLQWDEQILQFLQLDPSRLSEVVSAKASFYYKGNLPGLSFPGDVPFVIGASDGALSNLGSGAVDSKTMAITIGTSGAARLVVSAPATDEKMRTFCYHLKDDLYIAGGGNNNGAVVLQWLKEDLLQTEDNHEELFDLAKTIEPGCTGLLFLPYILGERAPIWNSNAKGVFFGLSIQHTKAHLIRAAIEGIVYCMYSIGRILIEKQEVTELHASGGFAKSDFCLQMLADVFNRKVLVSDTIESSALGAVMLGAEAMNIETRFEKRILSSFEPNPHNHVVYKKRFEKFERLYELLKGEMVNEAGVAI
ncbi:MAG: carbohydrate kinase [Segetibacter sp.]|nr:carbohydrate kinase [Segetibacter sp.]